MVARTAVVNTMLGRKAPAKTIQDAVEKQAATDAILGKDPYEGFNATQTALLKTLKKLKLGAVIDAMQAVRETKREVEAAVKVVEERLAVYEAVLLETLKHEGIDKASGAKATVSRTVGVVANVTDWDAVNAYIKRTGNFQLYQRRLSDPAYRELLEQKGKVPGVQPFDKVRLNLRTIT